MYHHVLNNPKVIWDDCYSPYQGMTYSKKDVLSATNKLKDKINYEFCNDDYVIELLNAQNIIMVHNGRDEIGRRSLGNRSILADPRNIEMKNKINERVKHRMWHRPYAPSVLKEEVSNWFVSDVDSPYMSFVVKFKDEIRDKIPAVTHVDGSARLQTVTEKTNKWYYNFLKKWQAKTGIPILLNTSANDNEPVVSSPEHALNTFLRTELDYLYFPEYEILVSKK